MAFGAQGIGDERKCAGTGRTGVNDAVSSEDAHAEDFLVAVLVLDGLAPLERVDGVVVFPGFALDQGACEVGEVVECARHRAEDGGNGFLAGHSCVHAHFGPAPSAAPDRVASAEVRGHTYAACHIAADSDA